MGSKIRKIVGDDFDFFFSTLKMGFQTKPPEEFWSKLRQKLE